MLTARAWLGPPEGDGLWPECKGAEFGFDMRVELEGLLGNRELVGPACELDRHANWIVCEKAKRVGWY